MRTMFSSHVQRYDPHGDISISVTADFVSIFRANVPLRGSHNLCDDVGPEKITKII